MNLNVFIFVVGRATTSRGGLVISVSHRILDYYVRPLVLVLEEALVDDEPDSLQNLVLEPFYLADEQFPEQPIAVRSLDVGARRSGRDVLKLAIMAVATFAVCFEEFADASFHVCKFAVIA
jgi:hypothetical protein